MARRRMASADGDACPASIPAAASVSQSDLMRTRIRASPAQDLTKRGLQVRGAEVWFAQTAVEGDPPVSADDVDAAGPCLIGALGGSIHAVHDSRPGEVQFSQAEFRV